MYTQTHIHTNTHTLHRPVFYFTIFFNGTASSHYLPFFSWLLWECVCVCVCVCIYEGDQGVQTAAVSSLCKQEREMEGEIFVVSLSLSLSLSLALSLSLSLFLSINLYKMHTISLRLTRAQQGQMLHTLPFIFFLLKTCQR